MSVIKVKKITHKETIPVRSIVLRKGKPIESCFFDGDELEETVHFGLFNDEILIGVASVFKTKSNHFSEENQFQLRGMAVLEDYQGKGLGGVLLEEAIRFVKQNQADILWFNARENAVNFYKNYNFHIFGKPFDINGIGIHYVMHMNFVG